MGINWQGAAANLGAGIANTAQLMLTAESQKLRDTHMAAVNAAAEERRHKNNLDLQSNQLEAQGAINATNIESKNRQAIVDREQDLTDADTAHQRQQEIIRLKASLGVDKGVTVNTGDTSSAYQEKFDEGRAISELAVFDEVKKRATAAYALEDSLSIMEKLNDSYKTGRSQEFMAELGRWVGTDASKALETYKGAMAPLVLEQLNAATGPQTDQDAQRIESAIGNFGTSNEANRILIDLMRKSMRRASARYEEMSNYIAKKKNLDGYRMPTDIRIRESKTSDGAADNPVGVLSSFEQWELSQ